MPAFIESEQAAFALVDAPSPWTSSSAQAGARAVETLADATLGRG